MNGEDPIDLKKASIVAVVPEVAIVDLGEIVLVIISVTTKNIY